MALVMDKFEEVETAHQQYKELAEQRESHLKRSASSSNEEERRRSEEILRQLEHTQLSLREVTAQSKSLTHALTEVGISWFLWMISSPSTLHPLLCQQLRT